MTMAQRDRNLDNTVDNMHSRDELHQDSQHLEIPKHAPPLLRSPLRALIQDFDPLWFTWCMNAGVLGILTHQCPYQFRGLPVISTIFFLFDLVLFLMFSVIFSLRFIWFGHTAYNEIISSQLNLVLCGSWPIAFMTLTALTALIPSNTSSWGHDVQHAFTMLSYVMWWFVGAWSLILLFWVFLTLIQQHEASDRRLPMMVIIPAVSVSTVAVTGALVVSYSYELSPRLGVPVIIVSFMMVGIGILLGFILTIFLFHALLAKGWPLPAQSASVFILVGPMGQSAAALQQLGQAARVYGNFAKYNKGTFLTAEAAIPLEAACILVALMLTGLGILWAIFSTSLMIQRAMSKQLEWTPGWNAIIFPMGTLATSLSIFAIEMDSPAFRVVTAALIVILVAVFLLNLVLTFGKIMKGELLIVREDPRVKKSMKEEMKER